MCLTKTLVFQNTLAHGTSCTRWKISISCVPWKHLKSWFAWFDAVPFGLHSSAHTLKLSIFAVTLHKIRLFAVNRTRCQPTPQSTQNHGNDVTRPKAKTILFNTFPTGGRGRHVLASYLCTECHALMSNSIAIGCFAIMVPFSCSLLHQSPLCSRDTAGF